MLSHLPKRDATRPRASGKQLGPAIVALLLSACGDLGFSAEVLGRRPYDPPTVYRAWWSKTERCSGEHGEYERVSWFLADGITGDGHVGRARWSLPHEIILVAGYETDEQTVRHEMLHDLLNGDRSHERVAWSSCELLPG